MLLGLFRGLCAAVVVCLFGIGHAQVVHREAWNQPATARSPLQTHDLARREVQEEEYCFGKSVHNDVNWHANNRKQQFRCTASATGMTVEHAALQWSLSLRLVAYGRDGALTPIAPQPPTGSDDKVCFISANVCEWFRNTEDGVKHGFDIARAPRGQIHGAPLRLQVSFSGLQCREVRSNHFAFFDEHGHRLLEYGELEVFDATGAVVPSKLIVRGEFVEIIIDDSAAEYPLSVDPLLSSLQWSTQGGSDNAELGTSVQSAGDVNGDGFSDVIIGAPHYDAGLASQGSAFLFLGSSNGLELSASWSIVGSGSGDLLGSQVASAGDVNADGFGDVLIASPGANGNTGRVDLYLGSSQGLLSTAATTLTGSAAGGSFGGSVAAAWDVNGDGYGDVLVGSPDRNNAAGRAELFLGSASGLSTSSDWSVDGASAGDLLGTAISAGDCNGDGWADIAIGAPGVLGRGQVTLYLGAPSLPNSSADWSLLGGAGSDLGAAVAVAGDTNGDGLADLLLGAPTGQDAFANEGGAQLFLGSLSNGLEAVASWQLWGGAANAALGTALQTAGDANGDGYADAVIGVPGLDQAQLYLGSASGLRLSPEVIFNGIATSNAGSAVAPAGDVDGDGFADWLVGAPQFNGTHSHEGAAFLNYGSVLLPSLTPDLTLQANAAGTAFGRTVANAGDVNGDGYGDVLVGTRYYANSVTREGCAFLYLGGPHGISDTPDWQAFGEQYNAAFGIAFGAAGDVNGDGYDDVIIGAPNKDIAESDDGAAYIYYGSATGLSNTPNWSTNGGQSKCYYGRYARGAGDVNGDGFADVLVASPEYDNNFNDEGRVFLFLGAAGGPSTTPDWTYDGGQAGAAAGRALAPAGDVNGDGYSDVILATRRWDGPENDEGRIYVFFGNANGLSVAPDWSYESNQSGAELGVSVHGAGDVNGDGFDDIVAGAYKYSETQSDQGRAYLFLGSAAGPGSTPNWEVSPGDAVSYFGWDVNSAGDINNDGFDDVIVGAERMDTAAGGRSGAAHLYLGSSSGLPTTATWIATGQSADDYFGYAVSSAGDLNGDGFDDLVVGAPGVDAPESEEGVAYVFYGNGLGRPRLRVQETLSGNPLSSLAHSDSATAFATRWQSRTAAGRARVALQVEAERSGAPLTGSPRLTTAFTDTGTPGSFGSTQEQTDWVAGLAPATVYEWRSRLLTAHPFFPTSPWAHRSNSQLNSGDLRTGDGIPGVGALSCNNNAGNVALSWSNGFTYTHIEVLIDGTVIDTLPGTSTSTTVLLSSPGAFELSVVAYSDTVSTTPVACQVTQAPATLVSLSCSENGGDILLSWSNADNYDLIEISRGGLVVATLPGSATSYTDVAPGYGNFNYDVAAATGGVGSASTSCAASVALPAPVFSSCVEFGNNVQLTWNLAASYDSVELTRDGAIIATLGSGESDYLDIAPSAGSHDYLLVAHLGSLQSSSGSCSVNVTLQPISALACAELDGVIDLAWTNGDNYAEIQIERDGFPLTTLPANATSFSDTNPGFGNRLYNVFGVQNGEVSTGTTCSAGVAPMIIYRFGIGDTVANFNNSNGIGTTTVSLTLEEPNTTAEWPHDLQGFSLGLTHDSSVIDATAVQMGSALFAFNGGGGPDYFNTDLLADGLIVVAVFSLSNAAGEVLNATSAMEMAQVTYETRSEVFEESNASLATPLVWANGLGVAIPVSNAVVVAGASEPATFDHGSITWNPTFVAESFVRGDINLDASVDITDVITLLDAFFGEGPGIGCLDAADTNDSGQVDIADAILLLNHLFGGTQTPASPFPGCGVDPTTNDIFDCDQGGGCL